MLTFWRLKVRQSHIQVKQGKKVLLYKNLLKTIKKIINKLYMKKKYTKNNKYLLLIITLLLIGLVCYKIYDVYKSKDSYLLWKSNEGSKIEYKKDNVPEVISKNLTTYLSEILKQKFPNKNYFIIEYENIKIKKNSDRTYYLIDVFITEVNNKLVNNTSNLVRIYFSLHNTTQSVTDVDIVTLYNSKNDISKALNDKYMYGITTNNVINPEIKKRPDILGQYDLDKNLRNFKQKYDGPIPHGKKKYNKKIDTSSVEECPRTSCQNKAGWPYYRTEFKWNSDGVLNTNNMSCGLYNDRNYNNRPNIDNKCIPKNYPNNFAITHNKNSVYDIDNISTTQGKSFSMAL